MFQSDLRHFDTQAINIVFTS